MKRSRLLRAAMPLVVALGAAAQKETKSHGISHTVKLDCKHLDDMKKGRPVFFGPDHDVRWGVSAEKNVFLVGEPILVSIWVDNRTDKPILTGGRCPPDYQLGDVFDRVWSQDGKNS